MDRICEEWSHLKRRSHSFKSWKSGLCQRWEQFAGIVSHKAADIGRQWEGTSVRVTLQMLHWKEVSSLVWRLGCQTAKRGGVNPHCKDKKSRS